LSICLIITYKATRPPFAGLFEPNASRQVLQSRSSNSERQQAEFDEMEQTERLVKDNRQNSMRWSRQKGGRVISGQNK